MNLFNMFNPMVLELLVLAEHKKLTLKNLLRLAIKILDLEG